MTQTERTQAHPGLSETEAQERLATHGPNALPADESRSLLTTIVQIASEPVLVLLLIAAGIYLLIGSMAEGLMLIAFALFTVALMVFQDRRSEHALRALRELGAPTARVVRDGVEKRIAALEVVPGDVTVICEGERIPADGTLIKAVQLAIDESLLTGESVPVSKLPVSTLPEAPAQLGGDNQPFIYSGTLVVRGHGMAVVTSTGAHTQAGKIGASLAMIATGPTPLQRATHRLVRVFGSSRSWSARGSRSITASRGTIGCRARFRASPWAWPCCPRSSP